MVVNMVVIKWDYENMPTCETKDKAFQEDSLGNFRITVKGELNDIAILKVGYIGITDFYHGDLPKGCALRWRGANFYKFKI